jgi:hypothetical protein
MMNIATSQYLDAPQPCRLSAGHAAACSDRQLASRIKGRVPINPPPFGRNDPPSQRIGTDQSARSTGHNSRTVLAAIKSP